MTVRSRGYLLSMLIIIETIYVVERVKDREWGVTRCPNIGIAIPNRCSVLAARLLK